jgi:hypothetical protein
LSKGDQDRSKGNFANAISHYEEAWESAEKAMGINLIAAASLDPTDVDEAPDAEVDEPVAEEAEEVQAFHVFLPTISR